MKTKHQPKLKKLPVVVESEDESGNSEDMSDSRSVDSDEELSAAFAKGQLKNDTLNTLVPVVKKVVVNNVEGLKAKLDQIKQTDMDWIERLDQTNEPVDITPDLEAQFGDVKLKINKKGEVMGDDTSPEDDFKREMLL